jgi:hypothetical protein
MLLLWSSHVLVMIFPCSSHALAMIFPCPCHDLSHDCTAPRTIFPWLYKRNCHVRTQIMPRLKTHSGKFSAERKFCKMWLADTNFPSEKNFEVENFLLLTMTFSENFLLWKFFLSGNGPLDTHDFLACTVGARSFAYIFHAVVSLSILSCPLSLLYPRTIPRHRIRFTEGRLLGFSYDFPMILA